MRLDMGFCSRGSGSGNEEQDYRVKSWANKENFFIVGRASREQNHRVKSSATNQSDLTRRVSNKIDSLRGRCA